MDEMSNAEIAENAIHNDAIREAIIKLHELKDTQTLDKTSLEVAIKELETLLKK